MLPIIGQPTVSQFSHVNGLLSFSLMSVKCCQLLLSILYVSGYLAYLLLANTFKPCCASNSQTLCMRVHTLRGFCSWILKLCCANNLQAFSNMNAYFAYLFLMDDSTQIRFNYKVLVKVLISMWKLYKQDFLTFTFFVVYVRITRRLQEKQIALPYVRAWISVTGVHCFGIDHGQIRLSQNDRCKQE